MIRLTHNPVLRIHGIISIHTLTFRDIYFSTSVEVYYMSYLLLLHPCILYSYICCPLIVFLLLFVFFLLSGVWHSRCLSRFLFCHGKAPRTILFNTVSAIRTQDAIFTFRTLVNSCENQDISHRQQTDILISLQCILIQYQLTEEIISEFRKLCEWTTKH